MYNSHKTYKKEGSCNRCGACCNLHCDYLSIVATRQVNENDVLEVGVDIQSVCGIFDTDIEFNGCTLDQRLNFPYDPWQTPPKCGFKWVEVND